MRRSVQLYLNCRRGFRMVSFVVDETATFKDASTHPAMYWPNGRWCIEVNLFLNKLWSEGRKHKPRGGTLGTYAALLTPLVHYVFFRKGGDFARLTDADFVSCMKNLAAERVLTKAGTPPRRSGRLMNQLGHLWLEFLDTLSETFGWSNFLGMHGAIRAKRVVKRRGAGPGAVETSTWTHVAIPNSSPYRKRLPITQRAIEALRAAASRTNNPMLRRRRLAMLELFDVLGFRRIEASLLRVVEVQAAIDAMRHNPGVATHPGAADDHSPTGHLISFRMRKQSDGEEERLRHAPISAASLHFLSEYLDVRARYMRRMGFSEQGAEGCVFFSMTTGLPLQPNTFTQEIYQFAMEFNRTALKEARIPMPCSPHMMRARYITREFVRLILSHKMENADDFRRALIDVERFKKEVALITGHKDHKSLDFYIDLAFAEIANLSATRARVEAQRDIDAMAAAAQRYEDAIANGANPRAAGAELARAIAALTSARPPGASITN